MEKLGALIPDFNQGPAERGEGVLGPGADPGIDLASPFQVNLWLLSGNSRPPLPPVCINDL